MAGSTSSVAAVDTRLYTVEPETVPAACISRGSQRWPVACCRVAAPSSRMVSGSAVQISVFAGEPSRAAGEENHVWLAGDPERRLG